MAKITADKIIWDAEDWLGGTDQFSSTDTTYYSTKANPNTLMYAYNIDPYRVPGYITVGRDNVNVADESFIDSYIKKSVSVDFTAGTIGTYEIGLTGNPTAAANGLKFIQFNSTNTIDADSDYPYTDGGHGAHTDPVGCDIVMYYANVSGTYRRCLFASFYDTTDWDVSRMDCRTDAESQTLDEDFMSTVPASPLAGTDLTNGALIEHPMIVGDDDVLYMGSGRYLHGYNGSVGNDGTFYANVLTLPAGYTITSFLKNGSYLLIFAHNNPSSYDYTKSANSRCFWWDYLSLDPSYTVDLEDNMCSESFMYKGTPCVFTAGRLRDTVNTAYYARIKKVNNQYSEVLVDVPGGLPGRGGVVVNDNQIIWNQAANVFTFGNNLGLPLKINKLADLPGSYNGLCTISPGTLMVSSGAKTDGGLETISATKYQADGRLVTKTVEPIFTNEKKGRIKSVTVRYGKVEATPGRKVDIKIRYNRGASVVVLATDDYPASTTELVKRFEHDTSGAELPAFTDLALDLVWKTGTDNSDAPIISSVEVAYETINI